MCTREFLQWHNIATWMSLVKVRVRVKRCYDRVTMIASSRLWLGQQ